MEKAITETENLAGTHLLLTPLSHFESRFGIICHQSDTGGDLFLNLLISERVRETTGSDWSSPLSSFLFCY